MGANSFMSYSKEVINIPTNVLKAVYMKQIDEKINNLNSIQVDENDTISLFHGTSTYYLNEILTFGLLTRKESKINNWENNPSFDQLTYLTKKWQYVYAYNAMLNLYEKENIATYPCYIEFKVPKALLVPDEDFINTKYMIKKLNKNGRILDMTWEVYFILNF